MDADTLVRAIRAAVDETERIAQAAEGACWHVDYCDDYGQPFHEMFDPAAVLRRVAADKRVFERHEPIDARVVLTSHVERQICAYCSDAAEHFTGDFSESEWLLDDGDQAVKCPCPDFTDLARGLGINPETETPQ